MYVKIQNALLPCKEQLTPEELKRDQFGTNLLYAKKTFKTTIHSDSWGCPVEKKTEHIYSLDIPSVWDLCRNPRETGPENTPYQLNVDDLKLRQSVSNDVCHSFAAGMTQQPFWKKKGQKIKDSFMKGAYTTKWERKARNMERKTNNKERKTNHKERKPNNEERKTMMKERKTKKKERKMKQKEKKMKKREERKTKTATVVSKKKNATKTNEWILDKPIKLDSNQEFQQVSQHSTTAMNMLLKELEPKQTTQNTNKKDSSVKFIVSPNKPKTKVKTNNNQNKNEKMPSQSTANNTNAKPSSQ